VDSGFEINGKIITKKVIEDIVLLNVNNEVIPFFKITIELLDVNEAKSFLISKIVFQNYCSSNKISRKRNII